MPRGDGTGPMGAGPMTGRGAGFCAGFRMPGFVNRWMGGGGFGRMGGGRGGRGGRGWRNRFFATGLTGWQRAGMGWNPAASSGQAGPAETNDREIDMLKGQAEYLENMLTDIRKRMDELAAKGKEDK